MDVAESDEISSSGGSGGGGNNCEDGTVKKLLRSKNLNKATGYLTSNARQTFIKLKQVFTKALILQHFDSEYHIWIETDASSYAISRILGQLTLDNLGQWQLVAYYSQKMILAET